ncbi:hypothetical protein TGAM01_v200151 [Trichoderma gamsii]|uniref:Clr5 domain-containing protein n=1 Tax=Trichoderma gamsii TaxID=398673 RepID=A0A2P5A2H5_9HYPO|nr:hypothetical protein TGAM01_v200151 [Trichoderma gamsii]PON30731.1 hypothetical protein TGAM01_v200151 [Trichoderma gamsii]
MAELTINDSRRAFQAQFRRWDFPLKTKSRCQDDRLLGRIKELWEQNFSPNEMIKILVDEGFDAGPHEIMKLRLKNRWLFRGPNNEKAKAIDTSTTNSNDELQLPENLEPSALLDAGESTLSLQHGEQGQGERGVDREDEREADAEDADEGVSNHALSTPSPGIGLDDDANATESAQHQADKNKKKRNRFKTDASGAIVRFPSEMTIDDARSKLGLDKPTYRSLRVAFQNICTAMDVSKKSAGSEKWEAAKTRLLHIKPELYHKLWTPEDELESKQAALDVICTDIAKRMRSMDSKMSVAEVKNALGINPQEARDARVAFNEVLIEAGFTTKLDSTPTAQQWDDLRRLWGSRSDVIQKILDDIDSDPSNRLKVKALDVLSRDTLKRLRDNRASRSPKKQAQLDRIELDMSQFPNDLDTNHDDTGLLLGPRLSAGQIDLGDGLSPNALDDVSDASYTPQAILSPDNSGAITPYLPLSLQPSHVVGGSLDAPTAALRPQAPPLTTPQMFNSGDTPNVHLDSTVGQPLLLDSNAGTGFLNESYVAPPYGTTHPAAQLFHHNPPISTAYAVYFRMHPSSTFIPSEPLWIATMSSKSVQELRQAATDKLPGAACVRIEGVVKDSNGGEIPLVINNDEHLAAFFTYTLGETPTFSVLLVWKTGDAGRF